MREREKPFALTITGGAQALGKEFPASALRVIQEAIKFPQSDAKKGQWLLKPKTSKFTAHPSL